MRTPEQILNRISVIKGQVETLTGQLCANQDQAGVYQDVINFMSESIRSLDNAKEELSDIVDVEDSAPLPSIYNTDKYANMP